MGYSRCCNEWSGPTGALVVPLCLIVCGSVSQCCSAPPGGESNGKEENGGRCGSHRHLRRRRGGIQPGSTSAFTSIRLTVLFSVYMCKHVLLIWSGNGVFCWANNFPRIQAPFHHAASLHPQLQLSARNVSLAMLSTFNTTYAAHSNIHAMCKDRSFIWVNAKSNHFHCSQYQALTWPPNKRS